MSVRLCIKCYEIFLVCLYDDGSSEKNNTYQFDETECLEINDRFCIIPELVHHCNHDMIEIVKRS